MKNKINVAEILRNCPRDMELNCTMYDNLYFNQIYNDDGCFYKIGCYTIANGIMTAVNFTEFGEFNIHINSKCVIFPKGKTTWEGFVPPIKYKDGDILAVDDTIYIYNGIEDNLNHFVYAIVDSKGIFSVDSSSKKYSARYATEEEKEILFKAIKENGYEWYQDTKSLVKLFKPNFKAGDKIRNKTDKYLADRTIASYVEGIGYFTTINDWVRINEQDNWELAITPSFEYGDVIENKNTHISLKIISVKSNEYIVEDVKGSCFILMFNKQDEWKLVKKEKFDISKLKAFESKVLVRDSIEDVWRPAIFGAVVKKEKEMDMSFVVVGGGFFEQCIPYMENEHLLGTTNDCCGYYKIW